MAMQGKVKARDTEKDKDEWQGKVNGEGKLGKVKDKGKDKSEMQYNGLGKMDKGKGQG